MTIIANASHAAPSSQGQVLTTLRQFKASQGNALGILELGIFGSFARGNPTDASDLDIYVKTKTPNPYLLVHIKDAIEDRVHRKVDIVRLRERMNPLLKARIEREGINV